MINIIKKRLEITLSNTEILTVCVVCNSPLVDNVCYTCLVKGDELHGF